MKINEMKEQSTSDKRAPVIMYEQQEKFLPFSIESLQRRIKSLTAISKWAIIKHDKDKNNIGEFVTPHYHVVLIFKTRVSINSIAKQLCDKPQQFEAMTRRGQSAKSSANNALAYLTHQTTNSLNKYQYSADNVIANFDYSKFLKEQTELMHPQDILDLLVDGKINRNDALKQMMSFGAVTLSKYRKKLMILQLLETKSNITSGYRKRQ